VKSILRLTLKNVAQKKVRFILTSLSVLLGVMFTVGVFIFTDSLRVVFDDLSEDIAGDVDLQVRSQLPFGERLSAAPIDPELGPIIEQVEGVKAVSPGIIEFNVVVIDANGDVVESAAGPPKIGLNWDDNPEFSALFLTSGRRPTTDGEFAINTNSFMDNDLALGETYSIILPDGPEDFQLVGTFNFANADEDGSVGSTLSAFDTTTAERVLNQNRGWDEISIFLEDSAEESMVRVSLGRAFRDAGYDNLEVVSGDVIQLEQEETFDAIITIFQVFLLAFAGVILLVSVFVIFNTFTIVLGQRIKEIGLMRALGATGRQIFSSIVGEAVVVGLFSSGAGIAAGLGLAYLLRYLANLANLDIPLDSLLLLPRTVIVAFIIGTGVTLVSALVPALRSRRVSPMAALRDDLTIGVRIVKQRTILGTILTVLGIFFTFVAFISTWNSMAFFGVLAMICLALGGKRLNQRINLGHWFVLILGVVFLLASVLANFEAGEQATALGLGALILIIGINLISPVFVPNLMRGMGSPFRFASNATGKLSTENAARSPRRTATTAAALMIGLTLVSTVSLVATSLKVSFSDVLDSTVQSDWFICIGGCIDPDQTFSPNLASDLRGLPELESVLNFRFSDEGFRYRGETDETGNVINRQSSVKELFGTNLDVLEDHINTGLVAGSFQNADDRSLAVHDEVAEENNLVVGDTVRVQFNSGEEADLTVVALYDDSRILGNWVVDISAWNRYQQSDQDAFVSALNAPGVSDAQAFTAIETVADDYPQVNVRTRSEFNDSQTGQVDTIVLIVNIFLFLALVIAFIGIANTLALSIIERTRELGLLRAVGMKRGQMLQMVYWEGVLIALFGGLLGIGMGIVFGITAVTVVPDEFISTIAIPWRTLLLYLLGAGVAGLVSALLPARRASRLNVLEAIATE